ncbi:RNA-binding protein [Bacillaceae bacterium]
MDHGNILKHFREEERPFAERVLEWIEFVGARYAPKLTDFLDPRQALIVQTLVNRDTDVFVQFHGGYEGAERKRAYLHPEHFAPDFADFQLALIELQKNDKFHKLEHRDYLGALLSLGIKREKFGDILFGDGACQIVVAQEIAEFVLLHLRQVHRQPVQPVAVSFAEITVPEQPVEHLAFTVASPRVDAVASDVFRVSRSKVLPLIKNGRLKVNWKVVDSPDERLKAGDVVSLKGYGRFKVLAVGGETKKGRIRVEIGRFL